MNNEHQIFGDENQFALKFEHSETAGMWMDKSNLNTENLEVNEESQKNNNLAQNDQTHKDFFENEHIPEI